MLGHTSGLRMGAINALGNTYKSGILIITFSWRTEDFWLQCKWWVSASEQSSPIWTALRKTNSMTLQSLRWTVIHKALEGRVFNNRAFKFSFRTTPYLPLNSPLNAIQRPAWVPFSCCGRGRGTIFIVTHTQSYNNVSKMLKCCLS